MKRALCWYVIGFVLSLAFGADLLLAFISGAVTTVIGGI